MDLPVSETALRLLAATAAGAVIGINRDLERTPIGVRTLALVSLGAATVTVGAIQVPGLAENPDALSRVVQGVIQGIMGGISFIGAGVILRDPGARTVQGLTTAAAVWVTAAIGIGCALGAWPTVLLSTAVAVFLLAALNWVRRRTGRAGDSGESGGGTPSPVDDGEAGRS